MTDTNTDFAIGDRFLGSIMFGMTDGWLTCDALNQYEDRPVYASGLDSEGNRGGDYLHNFTLFWKAGEGKPRWASSGEVFEEYREPVS